MMRSFIDDLGPAPARTRITSTFVQSISASRRWSRYLSAARPTANDDRTKCRIDRDGISADDGDLDGTQPRPIHIVEEL
jgi:hypothetical protein